MLLCFTTRENETTRNHELKIYQVDSCRLGTKMISTIRRMTVPEQVPDLTLYFLYSTRYQVLFIGPPEEVRFTTFGRILMEFGIFVRPIVAAFVHIEGVG
jgi:hypothetical protein